MSLDTETQLNLILELMKANGDYLTAATTTDITTDKKIISTTLNQYDEGRDGYFDDRWVYLNTTNNPSVIRKVGLPGGTTYSTSSAQLSVMGADLAAESAAQTFYVSRYSYTAYKNAVLRAVLEIYPTLHRRIDDQTLSTGNMLRDGHLELWTDATTLALWTATDLTGGLDRTSTVGYTRGGTYSAKLTASANNGNLSVSSNTFPELLQLQGKTVSAYAYAYPETLDDPTLIIDTVSKDGSTTQTLTSSTSCPAGYWTLIKHESQSLNDDLQEVKLTLNVATSGDYVYYDDVWFGSQRLGEYMIPGDFIDGRVKEAYVQTKGAEDPIMYDQRPFIEDPGERFPVRVFYSGGYKWLRMPEFPNRRRIRLIGSKPLETLSSDTGTLTIDAEKVPMLINLAGKIFWEREYMPLSKEDRELAEKQAYKFELEYRKNLGYMRMSSPIELLRRK